MKHLLALAAAAGLLALSAGSASALPSAPRTVLGAEPLVQDVACVTRRVRTVRPNGRVVVRTIRECGVGRRGFDRGYGRPGGFERCRVVRERVQRPNGDMVVRTVRRCG
jgi:hypothetical protein